MTDNLNKENTEKAIAVALKNYDLLTKYDNISNLSVGLRRNGEKYTEEIGIIIEIDQEITSGVLFEKNQMPEKLEGIFINYKNKQPFEEFTLQIPVDDLVNMNKYRPLEGGSQITNGIVVIKDGQYVLDVGTLGCLAYFPDKKYPFVGIISNHHVMYANGAKLGRYISQPSTDANGNKNYVATIADGILNEANTVVDYANAKVQPSLKITNNVLNIGKLEGFGDAYVGMHVQKYGRTTEFTEGTISEVTIAQDPNNPNKPKYTGLHIVNGFPLIDLNHNTKFADHGDSGSVIVDFNTNKVVGLLWGGATTAPWYVYATDQRLLNELVGAGKIVIPVPENIQQQMQQLFSDKNRLDKYTKEIKKTEHGKDILNAFLDNIEEGTKFNNENRECMVAWQRNMGPHFISLIIDLDTEEPYIYEKEIKGITVETMFSTMMELYIKHGSDAMRDALNKYGPEMLNHIKNSKSVEEIIDKINAS